MTPKERARRSAEAILENDTVCRWFGIDLIEVDEGQAVVEMKIEPHHCNGHGLCHGGVIFTLADSAFQFACNSRNESTLAQHNVISYIHFAHAGDILRATAREVSAKGRNGIFDVNVNAGSGTMIAQMRGMSFTLGRALFDESTPKEES
ncbi:hydroxyphenylacetyl-CoA thioesterase PaaI [Thioalkalivibrio sp. HK1]|uniref:hydroxyphenylacetyl-CoA thioesterase PaaI n=1 Tax=Thioalkalivibrio sp. HK1 TaxID=1469245 RepID=UPI000472A1A0|nr:hydroxyphenylacetyl-CoA thioesterase PaaI [Thioalkalivibrio sp. HK1]